MTSAGSSSPEQAPVPLGFRRHNHRACVARALEQADARCADRGLRLTPVRRKALEFLLQEHRALGAYDLLDRLRDAGFGSQPPVAYRALEFLVDQGFAHRIERLNAFVACAHPGQSHSPAFMICLRCDTIAEAQAQPGAGPLAMAAEAAGFHIERAVVEAEGLCPACARAAAR